ncbi:proton-conducting membrane transporter [Haloplanus pelagicus]|jgi:NADH-quinone oxidoreductase subunit J|uniref:proton-conducting membrane transporter n=1 Tax=Haloplanus pelagicus TaxID=2949995 RepID=UPI00203ADDA8|nr:proton-conducting membrane transporter [Haloplanus sp. HW8-1]
MTSKPELRTGSHLLPGLAAVALFVVIASVVLRASFGAPQGFASDASITASIGYAMFNLDMGSVPSEGFLVAFEIIDAVLVAALVAAVMLARRESDGDIVALLADGGRQVRDQFADTDADDGGDR